MQVQVEYSFDKKKDPVVLFDKTGENLNDVIDLLQQVKQLADTHLTGILNSAESKENPVKKLKQSDDDKDDQKIDEEADEIQQNDEAEEETKEAADKEIQNEEGKKINDENTTKVNNTDISNANQDLPPAEETIQEQK